MTNENNQHKSIKPHQEDDTYSQTFYAILASSVHDMKNSLGLLLNTIEEMVDEEEADNKALNNNTSKSDQSTKKHWEYISRLQYEASRVNTDLIQLLSLYKIESNHYPFSLNEIDLLEFLEDQMLCYQKMAKRQGIEIETKCEEDCWWSFDQDLICGVINDIVSNSMRYTNNKLQLSAYKEDNYLVIAVEDNGNGYPKDLIENQAKAQVGVNFDSGSTGLGFYFCHVVAKLHQVNKRQGFLKLDNGCEFSPGGGRFRIYLP